SFFVVRPPPGPPLFPYTTLFRSRAPAHDAVGDAPGAKRIFQRPRLGIGAIEERHLGVRRSPRVLRVQLRSDAAALVASELYAEKDRKSTRLNSSHRTISYAVFCL